MPVSHRAPPAPDDAQATIDKATAAQLVALGYVAKSPAFEIGGELASLALSGDDPTTLQRDVQIVAEAMGLTRRESFAGALGMVEELRQRNPESSFALDLVAQTYAGLERNGQGSMDGTKKEQIERGLRLSTACRPNAAFLSMSEAAPARHGVGAQIPRGANPAPTTVWL